MSKKGSKQGEGLPLWPEQQTSQRSVSDQDCFGEWRREAERRCWQPLTVSPLVVPLYRVSPALLSFHSLFLCVTRDHTTQLAAARGKNWTSKGSCWMDKKRLEIMYLFFFPPPSAALTCHVFSIWKARGRSGFLIAASFPLVKEKNRSKGVKFRFTEFLLGDQTLLHVPGSVHLSWRIRAPANRSEERRANVDWWLLIRH